MDGFRANTWSSTRATVNSGCPANMPSSPRSGRGTPVTGAANATGETAFRTGWSTGGSSWGAGGNCDRFATAEAADACGTAAAPGIVVDGGNWAFGGATERHP